MGYQFSYDKVPGHKFDVKKYELGCIWDKQKKILKKKIEKKFLKKNSFGILSSIFKRVKIPAQEGKRSVSQQSGFWKFAELPDRTWGPVEP